MTKLRHLVFSWICLSTHLYQVWGIECYYCHSQKSWEDCHVGLKKANCSSVLIPGLNTCLKQYIIRPGINNTRRVDYVKMCAQNDVCKMIKKDCKERGFYCEAHCCNSNLCNSSTRRMVSGIFCDMRIVLVSLGVLLWIKIVTINE